MTDINSYVKEYFSKNKIKIIKFTEPHKKNGILRSCYDVYFDKKDYKSALLFSLELKKEYKNKKDYNIYEPYFDDEQMCVTIEINNLEIKK